jgi:hypothetical protein
MLSGHRFSNPKIEVDIFEKRLVLSDSMHDFGQGDSVNITTCNKRFKNLPFSVSEDVCSHGFTVVGNLINSFARIPQRNAWDSMAQLL